MGTQKQKPWPNVYSRINTAGTTSWAVDLGQMNGKRERHFVKTREEAHTFAEQVRIKKQNEGLSAFQGLTADVRSEAAKANQLLHGSGVSLRRSDNYSSPPH